MRPRFRDSIPESIAFIILGIVLLVMAAGAFSDVADFGKMKRSCTGSTKGIVTEVEDQWVSRGRAGHYYVYITGYDYEVGGETLHSYSTLSESDRLSVDDSITVCYDPATPKVCYTQYDDLSDSRMRSGVFRVLSGVICIVYGYRTLRKLLNNR